MCLEPTLTTDRASCSPVQLSLPADPKKPARRALVALAFIASCTKVESPSVALGLGPSATVVARAGQHEIRAGELAAKARPKLLALETQHARDVHDALKAALDEVVQDKLLADRSSSAGLTPKELLARDVDSRVPQPTEAQLMKLYEATKASGRALPPFDDIREELVNFQKEQSTRTMRNAYLETLLSQSKIEVLLPPVLPPKVEVSAEGPSKGSPVAPVTIVEFGNFGCPFSGRAEETLRQVLSKYGDKVRIVFRYYPLGEQSNADRAAAAAYCAHREDKYWAMHTKLFSNQAAFDVPVLKEYASTIGVDVDAFSRCLDSKATWQAIDKSREAANALGVTGTPAFFINGRMLVGARSMRDFEEIIDHELTQTKKL